MRDHCGQRTDLLQHISMAMPSLGMDGAFSLCSRAVRPQGLTRHQPQ